MAAAAAQGGAGTGMNLLALSFDQLNELKGSIEEELQGLQGAIQQLQVSRNKLNTSKSALEVLQTTPGGKKMLVPITASLYVPGETTELDTVLVDVGTGYFIEKGIEQAQAFLSRKIGLIEAQAMNVQKAASVKNGNLSQTIEVMNRKILEVRDAPAAGARAPRGRASGPLSPRWRGPPARPTRAPRARPDSPPRPPPPQAQGAAPSAE